MMHDVAKAATTESDYFAAVDDFLRSQTDLVEVEARRKYERFAYPAKAMIAFCSEGQIPPINWFEEVQCVDISQSGFAFYLPTAPKRDTLIVIFRREIGYLSLFARIANRRRSEYDGQLLFRLGCQFLSRVGFGANELQP